MSPRPKIRCAIYTRKSSDEGLDQEFNSLDAQHEACAAYITSQRQEGWRLRPARYDDGGLSGGTLERPALQRLMADIDAGLVDMVVVYKIDRLTRSLADFARLVEHLEQSGCSFVSVTQAFNTSSSMGRLTLNVLLSFAQFEREVTAERIRDKIAASKKKGMWMGGTLPLGYDRHPDPSQRVLVINPEEARTVTRLFELYAEHGCLRQVTDLARAEGLRSKRRRKADGSVCGDQPLSRGQLHYLLRNPVYRGMIRHKTRIWPGLHEAIIPDALWDRVQSRLEAAQNAPNGRTANRTGPSPSWLIGKLRDETGDRLTPSHTDKAGVRHRYYVSNRLLSGGTDRSGWRLRATDLEQNITRVVVSHLRHLADQHALLRHPEAHVLEEVAGKARDLASAMDANPNLAAPLLDCGTLSGARLHLTLNASQLADALCRAPEDLSDQVLCLEAPLTLRRRGVETRLVIGDRAPAPDLPLRRTLIRAHAWAKALRAGTPLTEIARKQKISDSYLRTRLPLAFLSPRLQAAILEGTQPVDLSLQRMVTSGIPLDWAEQERRFGLAT